MTLEPVRPRPRGPGTGRALPTSQARRWWSRDAFCGLIERRLSARVDGDRASTARPRLTNQTAAGDPTGRPGSHGFVGVHGPVVSLPEGDLLPAPPGSLGSRDLARGARVRRYGRAARRRWPLVAASMSLAGAVLGLRLGLGINLSASEPRGIYQTAPGAPSQGALVVVCLPAAVARFGRARGYLGPGGCPGRAQPVLKRVGAVAQDIVELGSESVTVNGLGILAGPVARLDSSGRSLSHVAFGSYRVRGDEIWLVGSRPDRSWDSRYFGPVPVTTVRSVVRPVLTIDPAPKAGLAPGRSIPLPIKAGARGPRRGEILRPPAATASTPTAAGDGPRGPVHA
jgi:conjugative transfer signal peptidase TraF